MAEDPYRDELEAAHERIAALERELADAQSTKAAEPLPDTLAVHLDPWEEVLWHGAPHLRRSAFSRGVVTAAALWVVCFLGFAVCTLRGLPRMLLMPGGLLLGGSAWWLVHRTVGALRRARNTRYAITDRRVLILQSGKRLRSIPLTDCKAPTLLLRGNDLGDIHLGVEEEEGASLRMVEGAGAVFRQLTDTRQAARARLSPPEQAHSPQSLLPGSPSA